MCLVSNYKQASNLWQELFATEYKDFKLFNSGLLYGMKWCYFMKRLS